MLRSLARTAPTMVGVLVAAGLTPMHQGVTSWTQDYALDRDDLRSTGRNPFFVLEPGYQLVLEHGDEQLLVTVLGDTRVVDGVTTRVVEERESKAGRLVEVSRNYFAISGRTNSVYYFGEDVDMYRDGRIVSHEGAWLAGVEGARAGLMMPGLPLVGARYYQELAPGVAMDRARIVRLDDAVATPGGSFRQVLRIEESTPLEPRQAEPKLYAPGIGLVRDGSLVLVRHGTLTARGP